MTSLYNHLKQKHNYSDLQNLHSAGLLKQNVLRNINMYEFYLSEINKGLPRMQARTNTAEEFFISEDNVSKIVKYFSQQY